MGRRSYGDHVPDVLGARGCLYQRDLSTEVAIAVTNTWYPVPGMSVESEVLNGFSFVGGVQLVAQVPAVLGVNWNARIQNGSNVIFRMGVFKNGVLIDGTEDENDIENAGDRKSLSGHGMTSIVPGDIIDLRVKNITDTANPIVIMAALTLK